jgi:hypothetical protein
MPGLHGYQHAEHPYSINLACQADGNHACTACRWIAEHAERASVIENRLRQSQSDVIRHQAALSSAQIDLDTSDIKQEDLSAALAADTAAVLRRRAALDSRYKPRNVYV